MLERTYKFLLGDDIFISYSRADGSTYATGLANRLVEKKFSCRLDQWGTEAGKEVPQSLKKALKRSALLLLVGTEGAAQSKHVAMEIVEFKKTGRLVVPIAFDGTILRNGMTCQDGKLVKAEQPTAPQANSESDQAIRKTAQEALWAEQIEGLAIFCENSDALRNGTPSPEIINRIEKTFTFSRKDQRLRKTSIVVSLLLSVLIGASVVAAIVASKQAANAAEQTRLAADASKAAAEQQRIAAEEKSRAEAARILAESEKRKADEAAERARRQTEIAEAAQKRADEQTKRADAQTRIAEQAAKRADIARKEAALQESIARSRELSAQAVDVMDERLDTALGYSLMAFAETPSPTLEAQQSLLAGLTFSPHLRSFVSRRDYSASSSNFATSADGQLIVATEDSKKIILWRNTLQPSQPLTLYKDGQRAIWTITISRDGKTVAAGFDDKTVKFWDTTTGQQKEQALNYPAEANALAFNIQGNKLAVGLRDGSVYVWDANSGSVTGRLLGTHASESKRGGSDFVELLAFSPDDKSLASYAEPDSLVIWDIASQKADNKPSALEYEQVKTLAFSPDSRLLAFNTGRIIRFWDRNARALVRYAGADDPATPFTFAVGEAATTSDDDEDQVVSITFDSKGESLTSVSGWRRLNQWPLILSGDDEDSTRAMALDEPRPRDIVDVLLKGPDGFDNVAFTDDGRMFITQSPEGRITTWNVNEQPAQSLTLAKGEGSDVIFYPQTNSLVSVGDYGMAVWDGSERRTVKENTPLPDATTSDATSKGWQSLAVSADGKRIIARGWTNRFTMIDARSYETLYQFTLPKNIEKDSVTFDTDLRLAVAADEDGKYYLWELGEQPVRLNAIEEDPPFVFGNGVLVTNGYENLNLWDISNPKQPHIIEKYPLGSKLTSFAFSNDGKLLAAAGPSGTVHLWSVGEKLHPIELRGNIPVEFVPVETTSTVAISPDKKLLAASGHGSRVVTLWDISKGRVLGHIPASLGEVDKLVFSPDGKSLVARTLGRLIVWDMRPESWKERAQQLIGSATAVRR